MQPVIETAHVGNLESTLIVQEVSHRLRPYEKHFTSTGGFAFQRTNNQIEARIATECVAVNSVLEYERQVALK
jgi:hypothetical protein